MTFAVNSSRLLSQSARSIMMRTHVLFRARLLLTTAPVNSARPEAQRRLYSYRTFPHCLGLSLCLENTVAITGIVTRIFNTKTSIQMSHSFHFQNLVATGSLSKVDQSFFSSTQLSRDRITKHHHAWLSAIKPLTI